MVDLQMATEAFRDAFSACAPPLEGPSDLAQDYLLNEAYKSPANPVTGTQCLIEHLHNIVLFPWAALLCLHLATLCLQACWQWSVHPLKCCVVLGGVSQWHSAGKLHC